MKRISIAEQTLKKQIEHFYHLQRAVHTQISLLREQVTVYDRAILDLESEMDRLRKQREDASIKNKP